MNILEGDYDSSEREESNNSEKAQKIEGGIFKSPLLNQSRRFTARTPQQTGSTSIKKLI